MRGRFHNFRIRFRFVLCNPILSGGRRLCLMMAPTKSDGNKWPAVVRAVSIVGIVCAEEGPMSMAMTKAIAMTAEPHGMSAMMGNTAMSAAMGNTSMSAAMMGGTRLHLWPDQRKHS